MSSPEEEDAQDSGAEEIEHIEPQQQPERFKVDLSATKERFQKDVPPPRAERLPTSDLFSEAGTIHIENLKNQLFNEGKLHKEDLIKLLDRASELFAEEQNLIYVPAPVTVCGDIHGQFYDLLKLFEVGGDPSNTSYLFLGDYVDRGNFSLECVILLYAYKINYPSSFFMLRGNHECRHLTDFFTFKDECQKKYGSDIYDSVMDSFDTLPLAAIMNDQFICIHGGLSPEMETLEEIKAIDRFREPPSKGLMCDMLWSDPMEDFSDKEQDFFRFNELRGCSFVYGYRAVCKFLERNNLLSLIRAHEAQDLGFKMHRKSKQTGFPSVITLFSAPNYLDAYNNKAAVLRYEDNIMNIRQFNQSPHPYWLPNFMNVFTWSLPFVVEKIAEMLLYILKAEEEEEIEEERVYDKRKKIRTKIILVSRFMRMMSTLRSEHESIILLKGLSEKNTLPRGLLLSGPQAIKQAVGDFMKAKEADRLNEKMPSNEFVPQKPSNRVGELKRRNSSKIFSPKDLPIRANIIPPSILQEPIVQ